MASCNSNDTLLQLTTWLTTHIRRKCKKGGYIWYNINVSWYWCIFTEETLTVPLWMSISLECDAGVLFIFAWIRVTLQADLRQAVCPINWWTRKQYMVDQQMKQRLLSWQFSRKILVCHFCEVRSGLSLSLHAALLHVILLFTIPKR